MASRNLVRPCFGGPTSRLRVLSLAAKARAAQSAAPFSVTSAQQKRRKPNRDNNRFRGVSPLRRTGLREPVSVSWDPLPRPAPFQPEIEVDPKHGLYGFFRGRDKLMNTPQEDTEHGRAWTVEELRKKSWEDLHKLWWICCRERNIIATADRERTRLKLGFGARESGMRDSEVKKTMKAIKHTLTERYYVWEEARKLAESDPEIDLSGRTGAIYTPSSEPYEDLLEESPALTTGEGSPVGEQLAPDHPTAEPRLQQHGKDGAVAEPAELKSRPDEKQIDATERKPTPA